MDLQKYVIGIDQSTQGTKAILLNETKEVVNSSYVPHEQLINDFGWISHDGEEIYRNTLLAVEQLITSSKIDNLQIVAIGISNQRETTILWDRNTGKMVEPAIVWQCSRAKEITDAFKNSNEEQNVYAKTGIPLSPYFPAAKASFVISHNLHAQELAAQENLCIGTIDSWLVFKLTEGRVFKTDYSNASRTQLFNLHNLCWDNSICDLFHIPLHALATVEDSNGYFGETTFEGMFQEPIPIRCVMGDSHASLFGHGCTKSGMVKATYGTGSSIMMNIGENFKASTAGLVTSLAWGIDGKITYVLEGNINYSGAVVTWLQKDLGLFSEAPESGEMAKMANPNDTTYLVPAFSGMGAPYWEENAKAVFSGMTRMTGRNELVKAGLESIAYQVTDILEAMMQDSDIEICDLCVDGGPTSNEYLMQFQSDMTRTKLSIPKDEGMSAVGAAYMAGIAVGVIDEHSNNSSRIKQTYVPKMGNDIRKQKYNGWKLAVQKAI